MSRNFVNLFTVSAVFFIITACVWRSERDSSSSAPAANAVEDRNAAVKKYSPDARNTNQKKDEGDFIVEHLELKNARFADIDRRIKEDKLLEKAADKLNRALVLPRDIKLRTKDCGEPNAFYDEKDFSVTVCYELTEHFYKIFITGNSEQKAYEKMLDAVRFSFLHEVGHALIDAYDLPITGNEEDAADRCSAFINLTELGDDGAKAMLAAADAFAVESKTGAPEKRILADEHLLQEQRFYNTLCMLYGSDSGKYEYLVNENYLPKSRAEKCPAEYERNVESWENLLAPWRKK